MTRPIKIISGGQTGVDQAALNVAISLNFECGGWCPPGRICDNGKIPDLFPLNETPVERSEAASDVPRSLRSEWNVRDSDATLIIKPSKLKKDKGTNWTLQCTETYKKPCLVTDPFRDDAIGKIKKWLNLHSVKTLNIAGPGEKVCPGIGIQTYKQLLKIFG